MKKHLQILLFGVFAFVLFFCLQGRSAETVRADDRAYGTLENPIRLDDVWNGDRYSMYVNSWRDTFGVFETDYLHHDTDDFSIMVEETGNYTFEFGNTSDVMDLNVYISDRSILSKKFTVRKGSSVKHVFTLLKGANYYMEVSVPKNYLETHEDENHDGVYDGNERDGLRDQKYWIRIGQHSYKLTNSVAPTAIKLGYKDYVCTGCGDEYRSYQAPTGPLRLTCAEKSTQLLKISWNFVKTAAGYEVRKLLTGQRWDPYWDFEIEDPKTTTYTLEKPSPATLYKYRVRYWVEAPNGRRYYAPWSETLTVATYLPLPRLTKLTAGTKAFRAEWKKGSKNTGYQLEYALTSKFTKTKRVTVKNANTLKATVKKLTSGKVYYVRLRTYKTTSAGNNYFSEWTSAKKVKVK